MKAENTLYEEQQKNDLAFTLTPKYYKIRVESTDFRFSLQYYAIL